MDFVKTLLILFCIILLPGIIMAEELIVPLIFPQQSIAKLTVPKSIPKPKEASGNLIVDITPYPAIIENKSFRVEYYLNEQLLHIVTVDQSDTVSFKYILDTTRFENGAYKLIINFYDDTTNAVAIGIQEIIINNSPDEQNN